MKQFIGMSPQGNLDEALSGLYSPQFIMLLSNDAQFETHVKELEKRFPGVPSIGCIGMSYQCGIPAPSFPKTLQSPFWTRKAGAG